MNFVPDWKWYHIPVLIFLFVISWVWHQCKRGCCFVIGHKAEGFLGKSFCKRCDSFVKEATK